VEEIIVKDYKKIAQKIRKMGKFSNIYNCGCPTEYNPVNLHFKLSEPYIIGYEFYVYYNGYEWSIDYSLNACVRLRTDMQSIRGIKTDREMYIKVEEVINKIRKHCGVNT